jgi:hypothetical protein
VPTQGVGDLLDALDGVRGDVTVARCAGEQRLADPFVDRVATGASSASAGAGSG